MQIIADSLWVCADCLMYHANGELPDDQTAADAILAGERRETSKGRHWACNDDPETGEGTQDFSWRMCDCCGSRLGGSRHRMALLGKDD